MKTVEMPEATRALSELAEPGRHEPVIVTRLGKPVAAVVPIDDADLETSRWAPQIPRLAHYRTLV